MTSGRRLGPVLSLLLFAGALLVGSPAAGQDVGTAEPGWTPAASKGANLAFTLVESEPYFFTGGFDVLQEHLPDTWVRRALTGDHDAFAAMLLVSDGDISVPLWERLAVVEATSDVRATTTWLGSVVAQRAALSTKRFDRVGFMVAAQSSFKPDERPRVSQALGRLARLDGVLLAARGVAGADVIVFYQVGADLDGAGVWSNQVKNVLAAAFLEPIAEGVALPGPA